MEKNRTGIIDGKLYHCPASPNCVCSEYTDDAEHAIEPFPYIGTFDESRERLLHVLESQRCQVEIDDTSYIHAVFTTAFLRFKDDVEFRFDDAAQLIHLKSASRIGYSDLGANRSRIEKLRALYMNHN